MKTTRIEDIAVSEAGAVVAAVAALGEGFTALCVTLMTVGGSGPPGKKV